MSVPYTLRWVANYVFARFVIDGKRYEVSTGARDMPAARVAAARIHAEMLAGTWAPRGHGGKRNPMQGPWKQSAREAGK